MNKEEEKKIPLINRKILVISLIIITIGLGLILVAAHSRSDLIINKLIGKNNSIGNTTNFMVKIEGKQQSISVPNKDLLFNITITYDNNNNPKYVNVEKRKDLTEFYDKVGFAT